MNDRIRPVAGTTIDGQCAFQQRECIREIVLVLRELRAHPQIALLFTDLSLPGMDGVQVLREIQQLGREIAVVMLTAETAIARAVECVRLGRGRRGPG